MRITIQEILEASGTSLAYVPMGSGYRDPICRLEKRTLEQFSNISLEVNLEAFPLRIYLMGGNIRTLAIFPSLGGKIIRPKGEVDFNKKGYKLCVFPNPHIDEQRK